jgi:hypothetical protein
MLVLPFRKYVWLLGEKKMAPGVQGKQEERAGQEEHAEHAEELKKNRPLLRQIGTAVQRVSRNVPWRSRCYLEAVVTKRMLKRRGLPCAIHLGLKKDDTGSLAAHAWTTCGDLIITGGSGINLNEFTTISSFR